MIQHLGIYPNNAARTAIYADLWDISADFKTTVIRVVVFLTPDCPDQRLRRAMHYKGDPHLSREILTRPKL